METEDRGTPHFGIARRPPRDSRTAWQVSRPVRLADERTPLRRSSDGRVPERIACGL